VHALATGARSEGDWGGNKRETLERGSYGDARLVQKRMDTKYEQETARVMSSPGRSSSDARPEGKGQQEGERGKREREREGRKGTGNESYPRFRFSNNSPKTSLNDADLSEHIQFKIEFLRRCTVLAFLQRGFVSDWLSLSSK
jgi:hypothetical protein